MFIGCNGWMLEIFFGDPSRWKNRQPGKGVARKRIRGVETLQDTMLSRTALLGETARCNSNPRRA
jgi:hypothetical protein